MHQLFTKILQFKEIFKIKIWRRVVSGSCCLRVDLTAKCLYTRSSAGVVSNFYAALHAPAVLGRLFLRAIWQQNIALLLWDYSRAFFLSTKYIPTGMLCIVLSFVLNLVFPARLGAGTSLNLTVSLNLWNSPCREFREFVPISTTFSNKLYANL